MTRPLLSLVMIVKDEAASIRAVLESAKPFVDRWTILDTGSTDGTQDIVLKVMAGVPGSLHEEPFIGCRLMPDIIDYGATRNRSLFLAIGAPLEQCCECGECRDKHRWVCARCKRVFNSLPSSACDCGSSVVGGECPQGKCFFSPSDSAVFQLVLSGDEYLRNGDALRAHLEAHRDTEVDCHFLCVYIDDAMAPQPRVLRTGSPWQYKDEIHEYPAHPNPEAPVAAVPMARIEHVVSDPERRYQAIWERHIPLLRAKLEENPKDERALIFLAQSFEAVLPFLSDEEKLMHSLEAMGLYLRRLAIPTGTPAERHHVALHYLDFARMTGVYDEMELFWRIEKLVEQDPTRPETALLLAEASTRTKMPARKVYELASRAAKVAEQIAETKVDSSPVSISCAWRAHHLAAVAATQLAKARPDDVVAADDGSKKTWSEIARAHVSAGLAAGGTWDVFSKIGEAVSAATVEGDPAL